MSADIYSSEQPILAATQHFYPHDTQPYVREEWEHQQWAHGTGVPPAEYPGVGGRTNDDLIAARCRHCGSARLLVVALQWNVHPWSGDLYYDFEVRCQDCGWFTVQSYAEND